MEIINIKDNKNNSLKKANTLIKAKGSLSINAIKMISIVISMIKKEDAETQEYALNIKDFLNLIDSKTNNVQLIKNTAEELMHNPFWIDGKLFNWCAYADIDKIKGYIVFDVHKYLKPYLLELKTNFTQYHLVNILSLRGDYTPRLYEYLIMNFKEYKSTYKKQYQKTPKSYTIEIEIDWLREYLQIPNSYRYDIIKRNIIKKAQKQFKEKTNIKFDYEEQKLGRKVIRLIVKIEDNNKGSNDYMATLQSFTAYMRKNYINQDMLPSVSIVDGSKMMLSVSPDGKIYDKYGKNFDHTRSKKMWETMYQMAKDGELLILK